MNPKQLMDEVLAMLSTIRDDKHKLTILHEFMMDSIYEEPEKEEIPDRYKKTIQNMADSLLAGFICFFNPDTLEVEDIPKDLLEDPEEYELITGETWESEERKHEDWEKSIEIAPLDSLRSWNISLSRSTTTTCKINSSQHSTIEGLLLTLKCWWKILNTGSSGSSSGRKHTSFTSGT
ncbi:MAG: hypothetical protein RLO17_22075 [Cyclobacteriaceae bacterium]